MKYTIQFLSNQNNSRSRPWTAAPGTLHGAIKSELERDDPKLALDDFVLVVTESPDDDEPYISEKPLVTVKTFLDITKKDFYQEVTTDAI